MQLRIFALRFIPATERFDESAVTGFLADNEVVSLQNHAFVKNDVPYTCSSASVTVLLAYRHRPLIASPDRNAASLGARAQGA